MYLTPLAAVVIHVPLYPPLTNNTILLYSPRRCTVHASTDTRTTTPSSTYPLPPLLRPGDVLYMPRGTIHEAIAQDEFSTHVTISIYQVAYPSLAPAIKLSSPYYITLPPPP